MKGKGECVQPSMGEGQNSTIALMCFGLVLKQHGVTLRLVIVVKISEMNQQEDSLSFTTQKCLCVLNIQYKRILDAWSLTSICFNLGFSILACVLPKMLLYLVQLLFKEVEELGLVWLFLFSPYIPVENLSYMHFKGCFCILTL